jgi:tagatose 6-phosphate kinase
LALILAAGLTPAWQQIYLLDGLYPGAVNRAREAYACASGKSVNVALALHHLGTESQALVPLGGAAGESLARDLDALRVRYHRITVGSPTRVCTTLVAAEGGAATEIVENAGALTPAELAGLVRTYEELARDARFVVLSGSLTEGASATFYQDLLARTSCPAVLDARGPELLAALARKPLVVKPNRDELARTLGRSLDDDAVLERALREIGEHGAQWVVVTHGCDPVVVLGDGRLHRFWPATIEVVNPIASGDCLAAGIVWGLSEGRDVVDSIRLGLACAADNAQQLLPARLDPARILRLAEGIRVESSR